MKKPPSSTNPSGLALVSKSGPEPDPPSAPGKASNLPSQEVIAVHERRRKHRGLSMVPESPDAKSPIPQGIDSVEIEFPNRFLEPTCRDIVNLFHDGHSEYEITKRLGGRSYNVARLDTENVIRWGLRDERRRRLDAERELRMLGRRAA